MSRPYVQIAPMLDVSYRDFRYFMRLLTRRAQLWTEMIVDNTAIHTDRLDDFLAYNDCEHPIVCQVGGSHPEVLRKALQIIEPYCYDEINLNCGCPSDRVCGKGKFGAVLMNEPERVRECIQEMKRTTSVPVTVKTRIGVDHNDSEEFTAKFIATVAEGGCEHFIIHARKAWLKGLSAAQNRNIPPLDYSRVFCLCRRMPHLKFSLNGGIKTVDEVKRLLFSPDTPPNFIGVMTGRVAYDNPCVLWNIDTEIYGEKSNPASTRRQILTDYAAYLKRRYPPTCACHGDGSLREPPSVSLRIHLALKPVLGILANQNGNRQFRRTLDVKGKEKQARHCGPAHILESVVAELDSPALDELLGTTSAQSPTKKQRFNDTDILIDKALEASKHFALETQAEEPNDEDAKVAESL